MKDRPTDLLTAGLSDRLVGVIDLKNGLAVHAVAGKRDQYRPVSISSADSPGSAIALARRYRDLGLTKLYIADLDAIEKQSPQFDSIHQVLAEGVDFIEIYLDIGWRGDQRASVRSAVTQLAGRFGGVRIIAATESACSPDALETLATCVSAGRIVLGLDYRGGQLVARHGDESTWIGLAKQAEVGGVLALDLESVGTAGGVITTEICRRIRQQMPSATLLSGGGIRTAADAGQLIDAGCNRCLVATALLKP